MTFNQNHNCSLGLGSESMLPKEPRAGWRHRVCRSLRKLTLVSGHHPLTFEYIRSYPAMLAERQRHLAEAGGCLVHPFSMFSLIWNSFMVFVNVAHMVVSSLRLCFYLNPIDKADFIMADFILLALHLLCVIDMVIRFNTGYLEGAPAVVVLERRSIASHYLRSYWPLDLVSCTPVSLVFLAVGHPKHYCYLITHSLPILRATRLCSVMANLRTFLRTLTKSLIFYRMARHFLMVTLTMHWFACLVYLPPVINYYCFGSIPSGYNGFLARQGQPRNITQVPVSERYLKAMFIAVSAFCGTGFSVFRVTLPAEILINSIIILCATMLMIYNVVFFLITYMTVFNSTMRYQELMNQVEKYMRHKQFPAPLRRRVRTYYGYRYQERYFREEAALGCLSEQLRNEVSFHTCQNLLDKVALFASLPPTFVGSLLGCLKLEVYLPNELIVRVGDFGDCMYFLSSGTVAVYSAKGVEVCHLEDGDFFGALALMMKDRKRFASVVAIEITQVYRLDANDFYGFIMDNQELFDRIEAEITKRVNKTVLVDDAYRREREWAAAAAAGAGAGARDPPPQKSQNK